MDSLILDSLSTPFALTKITTHRPVKKATSTQNLPSNSNAALRGGFSGSTNQLKKIPTQGNCSLDFAYYLMFPFLWRVKMTLFCFGLHIHTICVWGCFMLLTNNKLNSLATLHFTWTTSQAHLHRLKFEFEARSLSEGDKVRREFFQRRFMEFLKFKKTFSKNFLKTHSRTLILKNWLEI